MKWLQHSPHRWRLAVKGTEQMDKLLIKFVQFTVDRSLVIIDDLMYMAMEDYEANLFFQLISRLYKSASIILSSNKAPDQWGALIGDHGVTTAFLDRLLHRLEVIHLEGDSYRIKNNQKIFDD